MISNSFFPYLELRCANIYDMSSSLRSCLRSIVAIKSRILYSRLLPVVPALFSRIFFPAFYPLSLPHPALPLFTHSLPVTGVPEHATNYCLVPTVCIWAMRIHFMLINLPGRSTCLFSWYGLLIMVGCVGGDFSQRVPSVRHSLIS